MTRVTTMIILPCHSIWKGGYSNGNDQSEWELADFQVEGLDHLCFIDHTNRSLALAQDELSCLIISGGQTKRAAGPISEAQSYLNLAKKLAQDKEVLSKILLEEYARDSFENVLFLICRFYETFGYYPESITIVGFEFKRDRFLKLHLESALGFPVEKIKYIGNSPTPIHLSEKDTAIYCKDLYQSEYRFGYSLFEQDWYGTQAKLSQKRADRNPFYREHSYDKTNSALGLFFSYLKSSKNQADIKHQLKDLPWNQRSS